MFHRIKLLLVIILTSFSILSAQDFILVHGWTGSGNVWNNTGVKQLLQSYYYNHTIRQPSLGGTSSANNQALSLNSYLNSYSVTNGIGIAHSMGGITTRNYLKNQYQNGQLQRINKLFTIGSPHLGTRLADNRDAAFNLLLAGAYSALAPSGYLEDAGSYIIMHGASYTFLDIAYILLYSEFLKPIEASNPNNAVTYINSGTAYENNIIKVGIAGTEINPVLYRMGAHLLGEAEDYILQCVNYVEDYKMLLILNAAINYTEYQTTENFETLSEAIALYSFFKDLDFLWQNKILQSTQSDGVVSKNSQIYPNYNGQYYANFASHMEQKSHSNIVSNLRLALEQFGVEPPPLYASMSGPTYLSNLQSGTWTVTPSGGVPPYSYSWSYYVHCDGGPALEATVDSKGIITPNAVPCGTWFNIYNTTNTVSRTSDGRTFDLKCVVTDANNSTYTVTKTVTGSGSALMKQSTGEYLIDASIENEILTESLETYPNPFNPSTKISFSVPYSGIVSLKVYDILGREVAELANKIFSPGKYEFEFDASSLPSGIYISTLVTEKNKFTKKMLLVK